MLSNINPGLLDDPNDLTFLNDIFVCNVNENNEVESDLLSWKGGVPHSLKIIGGGKQWLGQ